MPRGPERELSVIDDYCYRFKKNIKNNGEKLLYCVERAKFAQCPGAIVIDQNNTYRVVHDHANHEKSIFTNEVNLARQALKRKSLDGPPKKIIDEVRTEFGPDVSVSIGDYHSKRKMIERARSVDVEVREMDSGGSVATKLSKTIDGEEFLRYSCHNPGEKMLIFASPSSLLLLSRSKVIFADGTFACVPKPFLQLFCLHGYLTDDLVRPLVFCLLPDKTLFTYENMLREIKALPDLQNWAPDILICDFETNIKIAFENAFPGLEAQGCIFHLTQSWRRKAEKLGIYRDFVGGAFHVIWELLRVLPFIDAPNIPYYFDIILRELPQVIPTKMEEFLTYVQRNYVGCAQTLPRFPPSLWSCAITTANHIHRTTNTVESWHKTLHSVFSKNCGLRPVQLSDLVMKLREEDEHTRLDSADIAANPNFRVSKKRTTRNLAKDQSLRKAVENNPAPPKVPLVDLDLLKSFIHAKH